MDKNKKWMCAIALGLAFFAALAGPARAVVIEAEPDLHRVMGDLYALSVAMRLYHDDTRETQCPAADLLGRYLKKPLPETWAEDYRTAGIGGDWWVGRKVPEFSRARKFLRSNAPGLGLYDKESMNPWLGGSFVWIRAVAFGGGNDPETPHVAQGDGEDRQRLFFNSPGTAYYWWSDLLFTPEAHAAALKKFGAGSAVDGGSPVDKKERGPFVVPPAPKEPPETFNASPVSPPPDFTVGRDEDEDGDAIRPIEMGDVIFNPIPRPRN
ncbi:MAG: hypothetical protein LBQ42_06415 [Synergistaceae bacterium]|nr:hypothetical protein [Synergistaceae bacterium]